MIDGASSSTTSTAEAEKKSTKVFVAPLAWLTACGQWILTEKAYQHYVESRVVACYDQYFKELKAGHMRLCRWIIVRCVILVACDLLRQPLQWVKDLFAGDDDSSKGGV